MVDKSLICSKDSSVFSFLFLTLSVICLLLQLYVIVTVDPSSVLSVATQKKKTHLNKITHFLSKYFLFHTFNAATVLRFDVVEYVTTTKKSPLGRLLLPSSYDVFKHLHNSFKKIIMLKKKHDTRGKMLDPICDSHHSIIVQQPVGEDNGCGN